MKSIRRLVLLLLALWCGTLCVIFLNPGSRTSERAPAAAETGLPGAENGRSEASALRGTGTENPESAGAQPIAGIRNLDMFGRGGEDKVAPITFAEPKLPAPKEFTPDEAISRLLSKRVDLTDPLVRQDLVARIRRLEHRKYQEARDRAVALGIPTTTEDGGILVGFVGDTPIYDADQNDRAAISTGADQVRAVYSADGDGFTIGLWEAGNVARVTHQEYQGRVTDGYDQDWQGNPAPIPPHDWHATHVAGTLVAAGIVAGVKGMAPASLVKSHDHNYSYAEMLTLAAATAGDSSKIYLSNHSYGSLVGWSGTNWYGNFDPPETDPSNFRINLMGQYTTYANQWDGLTWNAPYHLIFKSAGNDRNDYAPSEGTSVTLNSGSDQWSGPYDSLLHPGGDDSWMVDGSLTGFGTISHRGASKNVLTVGAVTDAVGAGSVRSVSAANLNDFSCVGPTDDGRIKPDLVANGNSLKSASNTSDTATVSASGTSMASPNACGSAALLVDRYDQLFPGQSMLASTLKALLIHTADDRGNPGPDYRYGWGLMNVKEAADVLEDHAAVVDENRIVEGTLDGTNLDDEVTITHDGLGPLRVTICWTDPPGAATSSHDSRVRRLVHDLNLTITGPGGTHQPYVMPWVDDWSDAKLDDTATTGVNEVDNVEQVYLSNPGTGDYTIRVHYAGVLAQGSQEYSLVVSGAKIGAAPPVVRVLNPVADMEFMGDSPATIEDVANVATVFSQEAISYEISVSPPGILTAVIDGGNNVDLTPTTTAFGTATVTLTATDASANEAEDTFDVTIASPILYVDTATPAAPAGQDGFSWPTAFAHLQDALLVAQSGQDIWVAAGTYNPDLTNSSDSNDPNDSFVVPAGVSVFGGFQAGDTSLNDADPFANNSILDGAIGGGLKSYHVVDLSACAATAVFDGFIIRNGAATDVTENSGGGIYSVGGSATVSRCQIANNSAGQNGGGAYFSGGSPVLRGCDISDNSGNTGGGLYLLSSPAHIVSCQLERNNAGADGGGIWSQSSFGVLIHGCELRGNVGSGPGSIGVNGGSVSAVSSLFSGGQAWFGSGGVEIKAGTIDLINCTITANYTWAQEGGGLLVSGASTVANVSNCIIWNNQAAFSTTSPGSSIGHLGAPDPQVIHSIVHNSSQVGAWNVLGNDLGGNIDADPAFTAPINPNGSGDDGGDFTIPAASPAINGGDSAFLPADVADVDGDADTSEASPLDLAGSQRVAGADVDMGAFEFGDLDQLDADDDGISDAYEFAHAGDYISINPFDDLDGDSLTALAEFAHGLDPAMPLAGPVVGLSVTDVSGQDYLTVTYDLSDSALNLVQVSVERRLDLEDPYGWNGGETIEISSTPVAGQPGMTRIVKRSIQPIGANQCEFLRVKHERLP